MIALDRRALLAAPALLMVARAARGASAGDPFTLGVASGDPMPDGVVLWTRLAPEPLTGDGGMAADPVAVAWEVAEDERFSRVVARGTALSRAAEGHAVHVEPGGLRPDRPYWYRFLAGRHASPVGRTRTAPARDAMVDRLRLCFGSCQKYEAGHYAAYRHMVAEEPDLILFLGDYIYEGDPGRGPETVRPHLNPEPRDLAGYRVRYATYKLDADLRAAHAAAPWVLTWDDHEVANDYRADTDERNADPAAFAQRRAAAYQAYWEHQPLRRASHPRHGALHLYRTLGWGRLAQFQILDDRQYRGPWACQPPELAQAHAHYRALVEASCTDLNSDRTMLGLAQEAWLDAALGATRARWNLLAQQTLMTQLLRDDPAHPDRAASVYSADSWSGYPAARDRIFRRWARAATPNPLALGGDIHAFAAADVRDPDHPDGPPVASELVGGSITSLFHDPAFKREAAGSGIAFAENEVHGYARIDLTADRANIAFRGLADARRADSRIADLARFAVEAGRPGLQRT